jgi:L-ascorbate metabolism protein UlaG (beta-lactamase superfamily)
MRPFSVNLIGLIVLICLPASVCCRPDQARAAEEVKLYYEENAQVELIGPQGMRVLIDVHDPSGLSHPPISTDILLTTHNHADHRRLNFVKAFPGQQLDVRTGKIRLATVGIQGIASSHNEGGEFRDVGGSNYIFIVDMAGLRTAHFGDIGQDALTEEQLKALGKVDIAITQLANHFSKMNATNKKGFNLMDQVQPRLIIPTHILQPACAEMATEKWAALETYKRVLTIGKADLPAETTIVFMGRNADLVKLPLAKW